MWVSILGPVKDNVQFAIFTIGRALMGDCETHDEPGYITWHIQFLFWTIIFSWEAERDD